MLKRETEKESRTEQNAYISELTPMIITTHLASIKIFYSNVQLEELNPDGEVIGELDQGDSSSDEFDPGEAAPKSEAKEE